MMISENSRMVKLARGREKEYLPLKKGRGRTWEIYRLISSCLGSRKDTRYVCLFRNWFASINRIRQLVSISVGFSEKQLCQIVR